MVSKETGTQVNRYEVDCLMIIHGIFGGLGTFDNLLHEMDRITAHDAVKSNKKINWKETKHTHDSHSPRKLLIHTERWI